MTPLIASGIRGVLSPLIDANDAILKFWHGVLGSWGFAIIFLTFTVRLFILPLTFRSVKGMQELQRLQPEMKRIQERYKEDRQRMNQEMMKLYQEHKVNPLSSCLPLVLQIPFFISLFYLLRGKDFKADIAGHESFGFIPNLAERLNHHPAVLVTLIVLYVGTQLGASAITAISADPTQRRIMFALPFFFVLFVINFPAGLLVYWITTNVWTIGQQLAVRKLFPKPPPIEPKSDTPAPARGKPAAEKPAGDGAKAPPAPSRKKRGRAESATNGKGDGDKAAAERSSGAKPPPSPRKKKKRSGRRR